MKRNIAAERRRATTHANRQFTPDVRSLSKPKPISGDLPLFVQSLASGRQSAFTTAFDGQSAQPKQVRNPAPVSERGAVTQFRAYPLLHDCEGEEALSGSEKMVVAPWANARTRSEKVTDYSAVDG